MRTSTRARERGKMRRAARFLYAYGSVDRVGRVHHMKCCVPGCEYHSVNAHIKRDGLGLKSHWSKVVNLCDLHHQLLDHTYGSVERFDREYGTDLNAVAKALALSHPPHPGYYDEVI